MITRDVRHSYCEARQLRVLSGAQSQTDSTAFFASSSFIHYVQGERERGSSSLPEVEMEFPSAGIIDGAAWDGLAGHQLPVLECQSIHFFFYQA